MANISSTPRHHIYGIPPSYVGNQATVRSHKDENGKTVTVRNTIADHFVNEFFNGVIPGALENGLHVFKFASVRVVLTEDKPTFSLDAHPEILRRILCTPVHEQPTLDYDERMNIQVPVDGEFPLPDIQLHGVKAQLRAPLGVVCDATQMVVVGFFLLGVHNSSVWPIGLLTGQKFGDTVRYDTNVNCVGANGEALSFSYVAEGSERMRGKMVMLTHPDPHNLARVLEEGDDDSDGSLMDTFGRGTTPGTLLVLKTHVVARELRAGVNAGLLKPESLYSYDEFYYAVETDLVTMARAKLVDELAKKIPRRDLRNVGGIRITASPLDAADRTIGWKIAAEIGFLMAPLARSSGGIPIVKGYVHQDLLVPK